MDVSGEAMAISPLTEPRKAILKDVKSRGIPIVLISHNMPHVFEVADRIHIHRLGKRHAVIDPSRYTMADAVSIMTGATPAPPLEEQQLAPKASHG